MGCIVSGASQMRRRAPMRTPAEVGKRVFVVGRRRIRRAKGVRVLCAAEEQRPLHAWP